MKRTKTTLALLAFVFAAAPMLAASDSSPLERFAGQDLTHVNFSRIKNWSVVGEYEILLEMPDRTAYLLEVGGLCTNHDLRNSKVVKLPSRSRIQRLERAGDLVVDDRRCTVQRIREFDYAAYQEGGT